MRRLLRPRGIRGRLLLAVLAIVVVALAGTTAAFNVLIGRTLAHDADNRVRSVALTEVAVLKPLHGRLTLHDVADETRPDALVWVFAGERAIEAPRANSRLDRLARSLVGRPARFVDDPGQDVRLYAAPVVIEGQRLGTVVAAISLAPYERTQQIALLASLALAGLVLAIVAIASRWLLASALRPIAVMTDQAEAWSEHDLDRRFALGEPYDDLSRLAETLDGLLDRLAASLRREQRFSAELSHELRTPLAAVIGETELALRRERSGEEYRAALGVVQRSAEQMSRMVDTLVVAAQHTAGGFRGTSVAQAVAEETIDACAALAAERGVTVELTRPPGDLLIGVEIEIAERILQPVVENACRYARSTVTVGLAREPAAVVYVVRDDGPGVEAAEVELIFEPGVRGSAGRADGAGGAGLGLALARRLARGVSGDVSVQPGSSGSFTVRLPSG